MTKSIKKLCSISSEPLSATLPPENTDICKVGLINKEIVNLLRIKNGFYAFEYSLHVFPFTDEKLMSIQRWNSFDLWRNEYQELAENMLFFAEDAFGNQFCVHNQQICAFDAETGQTKIIASSLEKWAEVILSDYNLLTGYPLMHEWQAFNGPIPQTHRLVPKTPFVLGGEYSIKNLCSINSVIGMKSRGNLARQIKNCPDGTQIKFELLE